MPEETLDVNVAAEETASGSSTEEQTSTSETLPSSEDVNAQAEDAGKSANVPYDRFKSVNDKLKAAKEIIAQYENESHVAKSEPSVKTDRKDFDTTEAWLNHINTVATQKAQEAAINAEHKVRREMEMRELVNEPDFHLFADSMKELAGESRYKTLSPRDLFDLARSRSNLGQKIIKEQIEKQVKNELQQKQKAAVGTSQARESKPSSKDVASLINAKDETGKPLYSLKELREMLKGAK